jgi:hypothetical protein
VSSHADWTWAISQPPLPCLICGEHDCGRIRVKTQESVAHEKLNYLEEGVCLDLRLREDSEKKKDE